MEKLRELDTELNNEYETVEMMISEVVQAHCKGLDKMITQIGTIKEELPTNVLEQYIIDLAVELYGVISNQEAVGIKEDLSKQKKNEKFSMIRMETDGTVAQKDSAATLATQQEELLVNIYTKAYKQIKIRVEAGYEMLSALKKVLSTRISELELSNSRFIGGNLDESRRNN